MPSRRKPGCSNCFTCLAATVTSYERAALIRSSFKCSEWTEWWPAGLGSPTVYFHLRKRQLSWLLRNGHGDAQELWRPFSACDYRSCALLRARRRPPLAVHVPVAMTGVDEAAAASVQLVGQVVVPLRPLPPPLPSPATKLRSAAAWVSAWVSAGAAAAAAHHGSSHGSRSSSHERRPGSSRRLAAPPPSPLRLAGSSDSLGTLSHASSDSFGSPLHGLSRPAGSYGSPSPGASPRDSCMAPAPPLVHAHSTAPPASFVVRELAPAGAAADGASLAWKQQLQVHQQQQQAQARLQQQKLQQTQKWASACGVYDSRMPPPPPPLWHVVL